MAPKHVQRGQLPLARDYNDLVDSAKRNQLTVSGPLNLQRGPGGQALSLRDMPRLAIFEVLTAWQRRSTEEVLDDCISCTGRKVWYRGPTSSPANQYDAIGGDREPIIYHPLSFPGDVRADLILSEHGLGIPRFAVGDWMQCRFNDQAGRWEVMEGAETIWRFELVDALPLKTAPGIPSTATARLVVFDPAEGDDGEYVVLEDVEFEVANYWDGIKARVGDRGYAKKLADSAGVGWEVLAVDQDPDIYGVLTSNLYPGSSATMNVKDKTGSTIYSETVWDNLLGTGTYLPIDMLIWARWHRRDERYYMIQPEDCALEGSPSSSSGV